MVAGHELGHNLGLYHSNALDCGSAAMAPTCTSIGYGDTLDIMGNTRAGHFNAFQKSRLGWVDLAPVSSAGTYRLSPYETGGLDPMALEILKSTDPGTGKRTWYYVEHRRAIGFDGFLAGNANVLGGLVVHTGSEATGNSSYLLDMTPATSSWTDPALVVGGSFHDPQAGVTITPRAVSADGIEVDVAFGAVTCVRAAPTLAVTPAGTRWAVPGGILTYQIAVTSRDNDACAPAAFDVAAAGPSVDWSASVGASPLTIAPGATVSTAVEVRSPATQGGGVYAVNIGAASETDPGLAGSATASFGIASAFEVNTWSEKATYVTRDLVSLWATVSAGGVAVPDVSVAFRIANPNGRVESITAISGASGYAQASLRLRRDDPAGTYAVTADAGGAPGPAGLATTIFTVVKPAGGGRK
jgi:hypothetical protein